MCHPHTNKSEVDREDKIYPACAVTRAMARKRAEDETKESIRSEGSLHTDKQMDSNRKDSISEVVEDLPYPMSDTFLSHDNDITAVYNDQSSDSSLSD